MGINRDADSLLDAQDSVNCSAVRVDGSQRAHLALLMLMTLVGLLFVRRRLRAI